MEGNPPGTQPGRAADLEASLPPELSSCRTRNNPDGGCDGRPFAIFKRIQL